MEGMQAFGRRHFADLPQDATEFVCSSARLAAAVRREGEGCCACAYYAEASREALARAGKAAGVSLQRGLRSRGGDGTP